MTLQAHVDVTDPPKPSAEWLRNEITELTQQLYRLRRNLVPLYPWVAVLVCARQQQIGSIITPDRSQNKPMHEGIVVATWRPFVKELGFVSGAEAGVVLKPRSVGLSTMSNDILRFRKMQEMKSDLEIGDHVLFPHYAGWPIDPLDDKTFRLVRERDFKVDQGGIVAKVDYQPTHDDLALTIANSILDGPQDGRPWAKHAAEKILEQFVVVNRNTPSVTLSGV